MRVFIGFVTVILLLTAADVASGQWRSCSHDFTTIVDLQTLGDDYIYGCDGSSPQLRFSAQHGDSATWQRCAALPMAYGIMTVYPVSPSILLVGTAGGGVYRSLNGGATWTRSSGGPTNTSWLARSGTRFFTSNGYTSADTGASWQAIPVSHFNNSQPRNCVGDGERVYYSTDTEGVFVSTDQGTTWNPLLIGSARPVAVGSINPRSIACVVTSDGVHYVGSGGAWTAYEPLPGGAIALAMSGSSLFAGGWNGRVYRHDGVGWSDVSVGFGLSRVYAMAVNSRYVYAGLLVGGVYRRDVSEVSPTASARHTVAGPGTVSFHTPLQPTWVEINFQTVTVGGEIVVYHFTTPPVAPTFSGPAPVHVSTYRWVIRQDSLAQITGEVRFDVTPYLSGMPDPAAVTIYSRPAETGGAFTPLMTTYEISLHQLRAPVTGFSEFVLGSDTNPLTTVESPPILPTVTTLLPAWPNPFNPTTSIRYTLARRGDVRVHVFDATGRLVTVLDEGLREPGTYELVFNAEGLSSGMYFCRLLAADAFVTRTLLLLK